MISSQCFVFAAIPYYYIMCLSWCQWHVHNWEQGQLPGQRGNCHQRPIRHRDHHPGRQVMVTEHTRHSNALICSSSHFLIMTVFLLVLSISNVMDDEEEMLYGESNPLSSPSKEESSRSSAALNSTQTEREGGQSRQEPSHWCLLVRENGVMEVMNINTDLLRFPS